MTCLKDVSQTIRVPVGAEIDWRVRESDDIEEDCRKLARDGVPNRDKYREGSIFNHIRIRDPELLECIASRESPFIYPVGTIGTYRRSDGELVTIRSNVKFRPGAVVTSISESMDTPEVRSFTITYRGVVPVDLGDKFMNQTGHKFTVNRIIPEEEMPLVNGEPAEMVIPFEVGKRTTPSTFVEEALSLVAVSEGEKAARRIAESSESANEAYLKALETGIQYPGNVEFRGKSFQAGFGIVRIYRVDNLPSEHLKWTVHQTDSKRYRPSQGIKLNWSLLYTIKVRGADKLLEWCLEAAQRDSTLRDRRSQLLKVVSGNIAEGEGIKVSMTVPDRSAIASLLRPEGHGEKDGPTSPTATRTLLNSAEVRSEQMRGTVLDPRIYQEGKFGLIDTFDAKREPMKLALPPFAAAPYITGEDSALISDLYRRADEIVRATQGFLKKKNSVSHSELMSAIREYIKSLDSHIARNARQTASPRTGCCVFANMIGDPDLKPDQIGMPLKAYKAFQESNLSFALDPRAVFFRQPVHTDCELASVRIVPTYGDCIRVHPAVIEMFRGDFDGDKGYLLVPDRPEAYSDMEKLNIFDLFRKEDYWITTRIARKALEVFDVEPEEDFETWERDIVLLDSEELLGMSSWPENMEMESPGPMWDTLWNSSWNDDEEDRMNLLAGWKMGAIKGQTATAGGMSLSFIGWLHIKKPKDIRMGLEFYRMAAENSLSAKSGGGDVIPELFEMFVKASPNQNSGEPELPNITDIQGSICRLAEAAGSSFADYFRLPGLFLAFLEHKAQYESLKQFNIAMNPLLGILRHTWTRESIRDYVNHGAPRNMFEVS